jgi:hypothetical protein
MTAETRTTITLADIKAIEFECTECHTRTIRPLPGDRYTPAACPSDECQNKNWYPYHSAEHEELVKLLDLIHRYGKKQNPMYSIRFEVEGLTPTRST